MLAENLQDFAQRSGSARAYLMAAELRLLYPVSGEQGGDVRSLLRQALSLAPNEPAVKAWASQLDGMAGPGRPALQEKRKSPSGNR